MTMSKAACLKHLVNKRNSFQFPHNHGNLYLSIYLSMLGIALWSGSLESAGSLDSSLTSLVRMPRVPFDMKVTKTVTVTVECLFQDVETCCYHFNLAVRN